MCRLLGFFDPARGSAETWFVSSERSLLAQSDHDPDHLQDDGWGVAWYDKGNERPEVRKGIRGAFRPQERPAFLEAARAARGPVVIGHLRHASNPLHLPREELLAFENSQPFSFEGSVFAHNGAITLPTETRARLGRFEPRVRGVNDSEVFFWLLTRWEQELGDPIQAYSRTVSDLWDVWERNGRPATGPYAGLNILWTRGPDELWAFCHWRGDHGGGIFVPDCPYYEMTYRRTANSVLVGSEPFDGRSETWERIPDATYLRVESKDGHVTLKTGPIPLEIEARVV